LHQSSSVDIESPLNPITSTANPKAYAYIAFC
jgi:hypothetical protein